MSVDNTVVTIIPSPNDNLTASQWVDASHSKPSVYFDMGNDWQFAAKEQGCCFMGSGFFGMSVFFSIEYGGLSEKEVINHKRASQPSKNVVTADLGRKLKRSQLRSHLPPRCPRSDGNNEDLPGHYKRC